MTYDDKIAQRILANLPTTLTSADYAELALLCADQAGLDADRLIKLRHWLVQAIDTHED